MRAWLPAALALLPLLGCQTQRSLRDNTVCTAATLTEVNYQQVLDNVAMFVANPGVLPSFARVGSGAVTVADHCTLNVAPNYAPTLKPFQQAGAGLPILAIFFNPTCDRLVTENWALEPVASAERLRNLGCAFQMLIGAEDPDGYCRRHLLEALEKEDEPLEVLIPRGWYLVGGKHDAPKNACYVGHHCDTYVWVMPEGVAGLSRFTLTVLQLADSGASPATLPAPKKTEHSQADDKKHEQRFGTFDLDTPSRQNYGTR